jgi:hypothetical protein
MRDKCNHRAAETLRSDEKNWCSSLRSFSAPPPYANSVRFAVYAAIEFSPKAGAPRRKQEEVGIYTVKNDIVAREEFYYDGAFI